MNDSRASRSRRLGTAIAVLGTIALLIFWMLRGGGRPAVPQHSETAPQAAKPVTTAATEAPAVAAAPGETLPPSSEPKTEAPGRAKPAERTFPIMGVVRRADDKAPIEGAVVGVYDSDSAGEKIVPADAPLPAPLVETTTDAEGRYRLPNVPMMAKGRRHWVIARAPNRFASAATFLPGATPEKGKAKASEVNFELPPGGPLQGIVVDDAGNPVGGALVGGLTLPTSLGRELPPPGTRRRRELERVWYASAMTRAAADGTFVLDGFPSELEVAVVAQAEDHVRGLSEPVRAGAKELRIVLRRGGARVFGKLLAADDSPLPGHRLTMRRRAQGGSLEPLPTTSDADGSFEFRNVGEGTFDVVASTGRDQKALAQQQVVVPATGELEVLLKVPPLVDVRGRFVDFATKKGVAGVLVSDEPDAVQREHLASWFGAESAGDRLPSSAVTDAEGRFSLKLAQNPWGGTSLFATLPSPWQPRVRPEGHRTEESLTVNTNTAFGAPGGMRVLYTLEGKLEGAAGEVEFPIVRGIAIAGVVLRAADRSPVPQATVSLSRSQASEGGLPFATADEAGAFQLLAPSPGSYELRCIDGDRFGSATVEVSADRPPPPVELLLGETARMAGTVVDADGAPVSGYLVMATVRGDDDTMRWNEQERATVDAQGRFDFGPIAPGRYSLALYWTGTGAGKPRGGIPDPINVDVAAGERKNDIRFELSPSVSLHGTVKDEAGNPIEGASIEYALWSAANYQSGNAISRKDGSFELSGVPEDSIVNQIGATKVGYARETKQNIAWDTPSVDFTLKRIAGRRLVVKNVEGTPVTSYLYRVDATSTPSYPGTYNPTLIREIVRNSPDGSTMVPPPFEPDALYEITALELAEARGSRDTFTGRIGRTRTSFANPEDTTDIVIFVGGAGTIRGRVVDAQGAPVAGAAIGHATGDERNFQFGGASHPVPQPEDSLMQIPEVRSDAQGAFAMTNVPAGEYRLSARKEGMTCLSPVVLTLENGGAVDGVELVLHATGAIEGTVTGIDGKPVDQAQLWFHRIWREGQQQQHVERQHYTVSDSDGRYRVEAVAPGSYMANVNIPRQGSKAVSEGIEVTGGKVTTADFSLEGTASVRVLLSFDGKRDRLIGAMVRLDPIGEQEPDAASIHLQWGASGFAFGAVPPGRYHIAVSAQTGGVHFHGPVEVRAVSEVQEFAVDISTVEADIVLVYPDGGNPPQPVSVYLFARRPDQPDHQRQWAGSFTLSTRSYRLPNIYSGMYLAELHRGGERTGTPPNSGWVTLGPGLENALVIMVPESTPETPPPTPATDP